MLLRRCCRYPVGCRLREPPSSGTSKPALRPRPPPSAQASAPSDPGSWVSEPALPLRALSRRPPVPRPPAGTLPGHQVPVDADPCLRVSLAEPLLLARPIPALGPQTLPLLIQAPSRRAGRAGAVPGYHGDQWPPSPHHSGTLTGGLSFPSICWEQSFFAGGRARLAKLGPCAQKHPRRGVGRVGGGIRVSRAAVLQPEAAGIFKSSSSRGSAGRGAVGHPEGPGETPGLVSQVLWAQHVRAELRFAQEPRWAGPWAPGCGSRAWMRAPGGPGAGGGHVGVCAEGCGLTFPPASPTPAPGRRRRLHCASLGRRETPAPPLAPGAAHAPRGPYTQGSRVWGADAPKTGAPVQGPRAPRAAGRAPSSRLRTLH